jgi:HTH-type transcriptional regulator/antitoxin HigA
MKPKIIKIEEKYTAALARLEGLMDAKPGSAKEGELELWSLPVKAIKFRMEQEGLQQKDLVKYFPGKNRVSEALNHKSPLNIGMIRALHRGLRIPAELLLREATA